MPRRSRVLLANRPHHIIPRGHNRQVVFAGNDDYRYYLATMREWKEALGCKVYAYCLMTNHIHAIIDPGDDPNHLSLFMKRVAARQTRLLNRLERRSGTLWGSRFKSSPIETECYLLACCRYVEMNPVRAGMVVAPEDYSWSSCRSHLGREKTDWLDDWLRSAVPPGEWDLIRKAAQRCQLTGGNLFTAEVEKKIGLRIELRWQGRPKKVRETCAKGTDSLIRKGK